MPFMRPLFFPFLAELFIIVLEIFLYFQIGKENKSYVEKENAASLLLFIFYLSFLVDFPEGLC